MYNTAEAGAKGGLNIVAKRITETEDHTKEKILYTDMKSMYVHTMQQPLPSGGYEWLPYPTCAKLLALTHAIDLNKDGALITTDIVFPAHVHYRLADFPPVFEKKVHTPDQYPLRYKYQPTTNYSKANSSFSTSGRLHMHDAGVATDRKPRCAYNKNEVDSNV